MIQEKYFQDLYIKAFHADKKSNSVFTLLPGFPSGGIYEEDIAEAIAKENKIDALAINYAGLGKAKGKFTFKKSIEQSLSLVEDLIQSEAYENINIYGHSWGGLVAINLAAKLGDKLNKLILASPYISVPPTEMVRGIINTFINLDPSLAEAILVEESIMDNEYIEKYYNPQITANAISTKIKSFLYLQAKDDEQILPKFARNFAENLSAKPEYREVNQDHRFADRPALIHDVTKWINQERFISAT